MLQEISLKEAERKVFSTAFQDGLWDIFIGCVALQFAIAPLLSSRLGDFWSSAVFLPFWGLVMLSIWLIRKHVVIPRVGVVKFGAARKARLRRFTIVMLTVNIVAFALGLFVAVNMEVIPGRISVAIFGMICLAGFSLAAYFLDFRRLYIYGLLVGFSPLIGEWLYAHHNAPHHGFPITFGVTAGIMILTGLVVFIRVLRRIPDPSRQTPSKEP